jgi:hypothetical protein
MILSVIFLSNLLPFTDATTLPLVRRDIQALSRGKVICHGQKSESPQLRVRDLQLALSRVARSSWHVSIPEMRGSEVIELLESPSISANGQKVTPYLFPRLHVSDTTYASFLERLKKAEDRLEAFPQLVLPFSVWSKNASQGLLTQIRSIPHLLQLFQLTSFPMDQPWIVLFRLYAWREGVSEVSDTYSKRMNYTKHDWMEEAASEEEGPLVDWWADLVLAPSEAELSAKAIRKLVAPPGSPLYKVFDDQTPQEQTDSRDQEWVASEEPTKERRPLMEKGMEPLDQEAIAFLRAFERAAEHIETLHHLEALRKIEW